MIRRALAVAVLALGACTSDPYINRQVPLGSAAASGAAGSDDVRFFLYGGFCGAGHPTQSHPVGASAERIATLAANAPPIDDIDALCYAHDLCYEYDGHDSLPCDAAFTQSLNGLIDEYARAATRYSGYDRDWMTACGHLFSDIRAGMSGKRPGRLMLGFIGDTIAVAELAGGGSDLALGGADQVVRRSMLQGVTPLGELSRIASTSESQYPQEGECRLQGAPTLVSTEFDAIHDMPELAALAPAGPSPVALLDIHARRLTEVGFRLRATGAPLCDPSVGPEIGASFHALSRYDEPYRESVAAAFGLRDVLTVRQVVPGSPAALAGLREGDEIVSINGLSPTPIGEDDAVAVAQRSLAQAFLGGRTALTVSRGGAWSELAVAPVRSCAVPFGLWDSQRIDAFSYDGRVVVTTGLMSFLVNDDDLAFVLGRELAHAALGHTQSDTGSATAGAVTRGLGEFAVQSVTGWRVSLPSVRRVVSDQRARDMERAADYHGLYYAARAGYRTDGAADLLERFAEGASASAYVASAIEIGPERLGELRRAQAEIAAKRAAGAATDAELRPEAYGLTG
jgi:hypothetical protein